MSASWLASGRQWRGLAGNNWMAGGKFQRTGKAVVRVGRRRPDIAKVG